MTQLSTSEDNVPYQRGLSPTRLHPPIYDCVVFRGCRSGRHDLPGHETAGSAGKGKAQGSPLYFHPNGPNLCTPHLTSLIRKKRRPDESPAKPINFEAKFRDLAEKLEARFTERITAQVTAQCQIMIEATFTRIVDNVLSNIMTKVEEHLAHLTSGPSPASPPTAPLTKPLLSPSALQHGSSYRP
ncbi:hypothetical protein MRX96_040704 [Rhipicephalus microplus]